MRGAANMGKNVIVEDFPSFSEGLSLRAYSHPPFRRLPAAFPFLFGGTFIEGPIWLFFAAVLFVDFPSFSEGLSLRGLRAWAPRARRSNFPSFSEGLSLREFPGRAFAAASAPISLPFRRDFH